MVIVLYMHKCKLDAFIFQPWSMLRIEEKYIFIKIANKYFISDEKYVKLEQERN